MKISTKGRYALRLLLDLAMNESGEPIRLKEVAERQGISDKYLEQIIATLNKGGVVKSTRGAQGGYSLKKGPSEYTVGMILRLMEGSLTPVECVEEGDAVCDRCDGCATMKLWAKVNDAVNQVVDNVTLQDLVNWQKNEQNEE